MMLVHIVLMHEVTAGNLVKLNGCIALTNSSITSGLYKNKICISEKSIMFRLTWPKTSPVIYYFQQSTNIICPDLKTLAIQVPPWNHLQC